MKKLLFPFVLLLFAVAVQAQIQDPVKFNSELKILAADEAEVVFTAAIDKGWHVYSTDLGDGGPISATFNVEKIFGAEVVGKLKPVGKEISTFDKLFEMKVRYFENTAQFVQKLKLTGGAYQLEGYLEYGACNDENCLPPTQVPFQFSGKVEGAAKEAAAATAEMKAETQSAEQETAADTVSVAAIGGADGPTEINVTDKVDLWKPVINELQSLGETTSQEDMSWIYIFITGFAGGLLALFTPCVWPIIPMTVSFFLKRSKDKKKGIRDAWTYGASIVVIYVTLGLAITLIFGASALNALSTNAVFNILFCLMLVVFAASFFGAFDNVALQVEYGCRQQGRGDKRFAQHLPDGIYLVAGIFLLHGTHYRIPAGAGFHDGQRGGSRHRHAGLCHSFGIAFHAVCPVPVLVEVHAQVRWMDEHHQGDARLPGAGLCPEIPFGGRFGLRLAHPRP